MFQSNCSRGGLYPGNLRLVLVLRPSALLQRTLSDVFFRIHQNEFNMKVPVIMLSSVTDLHSYIDRSQLTQELGGTLPYCHKTWISQRTDVEGFAVLVKRMAHILQVLGRELAESELPDTPLATSNLLNTHSNRRETVKVLWNLRVVPFFTLSCSALRYRLLSQLNESLTAFDEFWLLHQNKLDKCLQLRRFEHNVQQVTDTHTHTNHPRKAVHYLVKWCEDGIYLVASQPLDKCQTQEGAESALQDLEGYLETANEKLVDMTAVSKMLLTMYFVKCGVLQKQVQRVLEKKIMVQEMFEKRRVSLKKLAAKQTRPVQPVAPTPEAIKSPLSSPGQYTGVLHQVSTLESFTRSVTAQKQILHSWSDAINAVVNVGECVLQGYAAEMDNPAMSALMPAALNNKKDVLFGNMQEILHFHKTIFLRQLESYADSPELVGRCFLERMGDLRIYEKYCHNKPRSESLWRQCSDCAFFQECQKKLEHKLGLDSYLLKPVQRITKYQLLLKELIKYSKGCEGSVELQAALSSLLGILKAVNDSMHLIAITGYEGNLGELGRLLMQGSFSVWAEHKRGHVKVIELARFKPMQRHLFLHERALLFCKRREESGEGYEKAPSYSFKQELSMNAIGITEHAKGDSKKFEIWSRSKDEVYTVQAASEEIKTVWVREIQKLLTGQLEACRGMR
uniref:Mcf.2 cell line derived transforming sequence-like b n=1 Tax=Electrophorus electricus TaxID=8005 RepID=A0A4W4FPR5_ELEEL